MNRRLLPRYQQYVIWRMREDNTLPNGAWSSPITRPITSDAVDTIEEIRPGYARMACRYLERGHQGVILLTDGLPSALGWYVINRGDRTKTVKGYYPLAPGHAFLHADWTHPEFRGQGSHKALITARVEEIRRIDRGITIETTILPSNLASTHGYQRLGFHPDGRLRVVSWQRWSIGRLTS